ncbi:MAG: F0F1 ATP synthase subunit delta [Candidatus Paceibacterota bacterium]|jgi:F0F1-type ATP synthase delta subunit
MKTEKVISYWARALYISLEKTPENYEAIFNNLKLSLGKRINYLPVIIKKLQMIYNKEKKAKLYISHDFERIEIVKKIKEKISGIETFEEEIDKNLLAGFRLKTKDILIKASLRDTLIKLKNKIYGHN